jgi:NADP-dependent 3-hydroxy acid dehydrogenase YdfG
MLLKDKVAVVYGAGGGIGGAVARAFAEEGARVFLTGRRLAPVELALASRTHPRRLMTAQELANAAAFSALLHIVFLAQLHCP